MRRTITAVAALAALGGAAPATAAITASDVTGADLVSTDITNGAGGFSGGYVFCPAGRRVLTGGAYWGPTVGPPSFEDADNAYLANSTVTNDKKGWYADGFHRAPSYSMDLTELAFCIGTRQLAGSKLRYVTKRAGNFSKASGRARCPQGSRVHTGGAFFHPKDDGPNPPQGGDSRTAASFPLKNGAGWYGGGTSGYANGRLSVFAWCLPEGQFGPIKQKTVTQTLADDANGGGYVDCPGARAALTGGAYWRKPNRPLSRALNAGVISSSSVTEDGKSLYATGQSAGNGHKLVTVVHCVGGV